MYPIATEKGLNEDGQMQYDVFGVKLKEHYAIKSVLEIMQKTRWLETSSDGNLFNKILCENERASIFSKKRRGDIDYEQWPDIDWKIIRDYFQFSSIGLSVYSSIFSEILSLAPEYFGGGTRQVSRIYLSRRLNTYLDVFHRIGFKIYRNTEIKEFVGKPNIKPEWCGGNMGIARANAMALMLLTGETTYFDGQDEQPIIINGVVRTKLNWQDNNDSARRRPQDLSNPPIDTRTKKLNLVYNRSYNETKK